MTERDSTTLQRSYKLRLYPHSVQRQYSLSAIRYAYATHGAGIYQVDRERGEEGSIRSLSYPESPLVPYLAGAMEPTRKALLERLQEKGYGGEQLSEIRRMIDAVHSDLYDVLAYIAFALSPISRVERVETRKARISSHYNEDEKLQAFLDFVLAQYVRQGVSELDQDKLPDLLALKYHSVGDAAALWAACQNARRLGLIKNLLLPRMVQAFLNLESN